MNSFTMVASRWNRWNERRKSSFDDDGNFLDERRRRRYKTVPKKWSNESRRNAVEPLSPMCGHSKWDGARKYWLFCRVKLERSLLTAPFYVRYLGTCLRLSEHQCFLSALAWRICSSVRAGENFSTNIFLHPLRYVFPQVARWTWGSRMGRWKALETRKSRKWLTRTDRMREGCLDSYCFTQVHLFQSHWNITPLSSDWLVMIFWKRQRSYFCSTNSNKVTAALVLCQWVGHIDQSFLRTLDSVM